MRLILLSYFSLISYSLPLRKEPFISENGLHPFFDNLIAEGWLANKKNQPVIEHEARRKYIDGKVDKEGIVMIKSEDL